LIDIVIRPILKVNEKTDLMKLSLSNGADPDVIDRAYGLPAICHAVSIPNLVVTEELLKHCSSTQLHMLGGQTLLTYAIGLHRREHVKLLLNCGADVDEVDGVNTTPLALVLLHLDYN
jgi:ankyrin repeat protein